MTDNTRKVLGVLASVAAAGIITLLFATDSGSKTRKKLAKKASKIKDKLKNKADEYQDKAGQYAGAVSQQVSNMDSAGF